MNSSPFKPLCLDDSDFPSGHIFENSTHIIFFGNKSLNQNLAPQLQSMFDIDILSMNQKHTTTILKSTPQPEVCDGIFTDHTRKALLVRTADCLPLMAIDPEGAVYALHCGRNGLVNGIIDNLGQIAKASINGPWQFFIGPHISVENYEVGDLLFSEISERYPGAPSLVIKDHRKCFDLSLFTKEQLSTRFPQAQISEFKIDTFSNESYNSFRRDKTSERNLSLIWKKV